MNPRASNSKAVPLQTLQAFLAGAGSQPMVTPFDPEAPALADGTKIETFELDRDADGRPGWVVQRFQLGDEKPHALSIYVRKDASSTSGQHKPSGLWARESTGDFAFSFFAHFDTQRRMALGITDASGRLSRCWLDKNRDGVADLAWTRDAQGNWKKAPAGFAMFDKAWLTADLQTDLNAILSWLRGK